MKHYQEMPLTLLSPSVCKLGNHPFELYVTTVNPLRHLLISSLALDKGQRGSDGPNEDVTVVFVVRRCPDRVTPHSNPQRFGSCRAI